MNVHATMTPADLWNHLKGLFKQGKKLCEAFKCEVADVPTLRVPFVTVNAPVFLRSVPVQLFLSYLEMALHRLPYSRLFWRVLKLATLG